MCTISWSRDNLRVPTSPKRNRYSFSRNYKLWIAHQLWVGPGEFLPTPCWNFSCPDHEQVTTAAGVYENSSHSISRRQRPTVTVPILHAPTSLLDNVPQDVPLGAKHSQLLVLGTLTSSGLCLRALISKNGTMIESLAIGSEHIVSTMLFCIPRAGIFYSRNLRV